MSTTAVQRLLQSFDRLPDPRKREVAAEIMRRTAQMEFPALEHDELVLAAEDVFLEFDRCEAAASSHDPTCHAGAAEPTEPDRREPTRA